MTGIETAQATAPDISSLASHFMLDLATYSTGGELGFAGMDFYVAGRGGVLGDVDADVVAAGMVFFSPVAVRAGWEASASVMPRAAAAAAFIECGYAWAQSHLDDSVDWNRLADLAETVVKAASPPCAPVFAGWRAVPAPGADQAKPRALHHLNLLRELRMALHGVGVLAAGLAPLEAMLVRSPHMVPIFGWTAPDPGPDLAPLQKLWDEAEATTDRLLADAINALTAAEQVEFTTLLTASRAAIS